MLIKQELIKKVKVLFSLNIYETKVWLALLSKGVASASEIAELSGVPRSRTYDVLESLEKQGFAIQRLGKPVKFLAVKPAMVIDKLKNNVEKEAEERTVTLNKLKGTEEYSELEVLQKQGIAPIKVSELSSALKGRTDIHSQLKEMISNAKEEVVLVTNYEGLKRKLYFIKPLIAKLAKKNVKVRIGVNASEEEFAKLLKEKELEKAELKQVELNARFCLVDKEQFLFMVLPKADAEQDIGIWLNSDFFTGAFKTLFNASWK